MEAGQNDCQQYRQGRALREETPSRWRHPSYRGFSQALATTFLSFYLCSPQVISRSNSNSAAQCIIFIYNACRRKSPNDIYYTEKDWRPFLIPPIDIALHPVRAASSGEYFFLAFPKSYL